MIIQIITVLGSAPPTCPHFCSRGVFHLMVMCVSRKTLSQQNITTVNQLVKICQRDVSSDLTTAQAHCLLQSVTVDLFAPCAHAKPLPYALKFSRFLRFG